MINHDANHKLIPIMKTIAKQMIIMVSFRPEFLTNLVKSNLCKIVNPNSKKTHLIIHLVTRDFLSIILRKLFKKIIDFRKKYFKLSYGEKLIIEIRNI